MNFLNSGPGFMDQRQILVDHLPQFGVVQFNPQTSKALISKFSLPSRVRGSLLNAWHLEVVPLSISFGNHSPIPLSLLLRILVAQRCTHTLLQQLAGPKSTVGSRWAIQGCRNTFSVRESISKEMNPHHQSSHLSSSKADSQSCQKRRGSPS